MRRQLGGFLKNVFQLFVCPPLFSRKCYSAVLQQSNILGKIYREYMGIYSVVLLNCGRNSIRKYQLANFTGVKTITKVHKKRHKFLMSVTEHIDSMRRHN